METIAYGIVWIIHNAGQIHPVTVVNLMGVAALVILLVNVRRSSR